MSAANDTAPAPGPVGDSGFDWSRAIHADLFRPALIGLVTLGVFGLGFVIWASTAPITGAAVATGTIVAEDHNVRVQHLEGGIVASVEVREGDHVEKGTALVTLDRSSAAASLARLESRLAVLKAQEARLIAQRDDAATIVFPDELRARADQPDIAALMQDQEAEYEARRSRYLTETAILQERIGALEREITGHEAELEAAREQLALTEEEIEAVAGLFEQQLTGRERLTALKRSAAGFRGQVGDATASIAALERNITEVREQIAGAVTGRLEEALTTLTDVRANIADVERQLVAAADAVNRIVIRAPVPGTLVKLHATTAGAVIAPGGLVAEILPRDARKLVEAQLPPQDIDVVKPGQAAHLRLTALDRRTTPTVPATVAYVSADRLVDANNGRAYYTVRLTIDEPLPDAVSDDDLYPGMQVEAYIRTGERTFFAYLVKPIVDSFARAFREE